MQVDSMELKKQEERNRRESWAVRRGEHRTCERLRSTNWRRLELQEDKRKKKSNFSDRGVGIHQEFPSLLSFPSFCCSLVLVLL